MEAVPELLDLMCEQHTLSQQKEAVFDKIQTHPLYCNTLADVVSILKTHYGYKAVKKRTTDSWPMIHITLSTQPEIILKLTDKNQRGCHVVKYVLTIDGNPYFLQKGVVTPMPAKRKLVFTQDEIGLRVNYDTCYFNDLDANAYNSRACAPNEILLWAIEAIKIISTTNIQ